MDFILSWIEHYGYLGLFASLMLGIFGLPITDETILTFAGFLIHQHTLAPTPSLVAAFLGSTCGMTVNYMAGRWLGLAFLHKYGARLHITPAQVVQVHDWFERHGKWLLPVGYFLPGVRHLAPFIAGASRLQFHQFALFAFSGGICWVLTFLLLGYFLGAEWPRLLPKVHIFLWAAVAAAAGLALVYLVWRRRWFRRSQIPQ